MDCVRYYRNFSILIIAVVNLCIHQVYGPRDYSVPGLLKIEGHLMNTGRCWRSRRTGEDGEGCLDPWTCNQRRRHKFICKSCDDCMDSSLRVLEVFQLNCCRYWCLEFSPFYGTFHFLENDEQSGEIFGISKGLGRRLRDSHGKIFLTHGSSTSVH